jgi:hypothetical protein
MTIVRKIFLSMVVVVVCMSAYTLLTMYAMLVVERNIGNDKDRNLNIVRNVDKLQLAVAQQQRSVLLVSSGFTGTPAELQSSKDESLAAIAAIKRLVTRKDELVALDAIASDVNSFYTVTVRLGGRPNRPCA